MKKQILLLEIRAAAPAMSGRGVCFGAICEASAESKQIPAPEPVKRSLEEARLTVRISQEAESVRGANFRFSRDAKDVFLL